MLHGKTVVLTRQKEQAAEMVRLIEEKGGNALCFPTIATAPTEKTEARDAALCRLATYDWLVFSSENAVRYFFEALRSLKKQWPEIKVAAVGSKTARALRDLHIEPDLLPQKFTARGLLTAFANRGVQGQRFLLPVSHIARKELPEGLRALGAEADVVEFYRTLPHPDFDRQAFLRLLQQQAACVLTFFSPSAFHSLLELLGEGAVEALKQSGVILAAIGPTTARAVTQAGLPVEIVPKVNDGRHLLEAIEVYFEQKE
jgi:uroporphyrinogen-III synthase